MRRRLQSVCATLAAGLACAAASYAAEPEPATSALELGVVTWRVESLLADAAGTAAWVQGPDGSWRLDLARAENGDPEAGTAEAVLGRLGEGWTAAAPGDGSVILQAWDGPLRTLEPDQAARLAALLSLSATGGDPGRAEVGPAVWRQRSGGAGHARRVPWEEPAPAPTRSVLVWPAPDDGTSTLARDLASRGLGRGGAGEVWLVEAARDGGVHLESRRYAASLELGPPRREVRWGDPFEVVLPLWPLGEVLTDGADR